MKNDRLPTPSQAGYAKAVDKLNNNDAGDAIDWLQDTDCRASVTALVDAILMHHPNEDSDLQ
jgi:hypothetical protein